MQDNQENDLKNIDAKLLTEFLKNLSDGDPNVGLDVAQFFWGHLPSNEVNLHIAVIETLIFQSAALGSVDAQNYLKDMWPDMKEALIKRMIRRGFQNEWGDAMEQFRTSDN